MVLSEGETVATHIPTSLDNDTKLVLAVSLSVAKARKKMGKVVKKLIQIKNTQTITFKHT